MAEKDDLKRLPPEERIKRLKKLEEEKRKEIEEAQKLMKESAIELEREEKIRQEVPIPQMKAVDIGELFTQEEKQLFATKRYQKAEQKGEEAEEAKPEKEEKTLEDEVWKSDFKLSEEQMHEQRAYGEKLAKEGAGQMYALAKEAYDQFKETGQVDQGTIYALDVATRENEGPSGEYRSSSEIAQEQFGSVKSIVKYLRGKI